MRILLLLLLCSCYTAKKAEKDLDKVQRNHPEVLAKRSSLLYPVTQRADSQNVIIWRDSVLNYFSTINDTNCVKIVKQIKYKVLESPIVTIYREDSAKIYGYMNQYSKAIFERDKYKDRFELLKTLIIFLLLLLIISLIVHIIKR